MDDPSRVDVFKSSLTPGESQGMKAGENAHEDLIKEVLDKLFLQRARGQQTV